jgi:putative SOS response-associated peptidase YedK
MPVMLPPGAWERWLDPAYEDVDALGKLLVPAPSGIIELHPVSTLVNNVRENGSELIEAVDPEAVVEASQGSLL